MPNIPPKANRSWKNCFSPFLYRDRNAIERMFGRLKDFRRVATRYDRIADKLPRRCLPRRNCQLLVISPGPKRAFRGHRNSSVTHRPPLKSAFHKLSLNEAVTGLPRSASSRDSMIVL